MKKLLIIIPFFLGSCGDDNTVKISKDEYLKLKGDTLVSKYPKPFKLYDNGLFSWSNSDGIALGSDGHEYLVYDWGSHGQNINHYIDCEKCKQQKQIENEKLINRIIDSLRTK